LDLAEARLEAQHTAVAVLDGRNASLQAAAIGAEMTVRQWSTLTGADLAALDAFRRDVRRRQGELNAQLAAARGDLERLQTAMLDARRNCRLLERLRERRLAEWNSAAERELEQLAG